MSVEQPEVNTMKNYFSLHYTVLKVCGIGLDPPKSLIAKLSYNLYALFITTVVYCCFILGEIFGLMWQENSVEDTAFLLTYMLTHILALAKLALFFGLKHHIHKVCVALQSGVFRPNPERGGDREHQYVKDAIKLTNSQAWFFYICLNFMLFLYSVNAMLNTMRDEEQFYDSAANETTTRTIKKLFYPAWYPFSADKSPVYEFTCIYQIACALVYGYIVGACDSLICSILCHIKAQLQILVNSVRCIMERTEKMMRKDGFDVDLSSYTKSPFDNSNVQLIPANVQRYIDICIRDCIDHYQQIIDIAQETESSFNYLLLIQFFGSLLLICFQLFNLSLNVTEQAGGTPTDSLSMITYCMLATFQVLIFCWHGNEIMLISDSLPSIIFETNWYINSISSRKSLLLMMVRGYRPIKMTAGKFTFLSLDTFVTVIRGAGSYFMVLRNMNMPD